MRQRERQRTEAHDDDAPADPARLRGAGTAAKVRHRHQAQEGRNVVAARHQAGLRGAQPEAPLNGGDDDVDAPVYHQSCV